MEVNTSGETRQSFNNSSRRWAHAGVIFSPPWHGMPIGDARWKRLIQQCVTGCNWGQKRRDSRYKVMLQKYGVTILPASLDLSGAEIELAAVPGREFLLREA